VIGAIVAEAMPAQLACTVLGASESGYYAWRGRPPSERAIRHAWLTDLIAEIHAASRATYGARRIHAELTLGRGIAVGHNQVELLMRRAGLAGLPARRRFRAAAIAPSVADLLDRNFSASRPDALWITDITEHPTREGKVYAASSSMPSRAGWSAGRSTPPRPRPL
jgi:hypothetical protein